MKPIITLSLLILTLVLRAQTFTSWTTADGLPSDDLRDVAIVGDGTIWLATSQGVAAFDGSTFTVHTTTSHPGLANNDVMAIAVRANGDVWVGTDVGVSVFNGTSYTTYTTADGLGDDQVNSIEEAPNGDVWITTINGATLYSGGSFTAFGSPDIPFGGALHTAFASNGDVLLSGGLGGVLIYNGSSFGTVTTGQGLLSNRIRAIAVDNDLRKWVATAEGISVLDASNAHETDHEFVFLLPPPDELNPITDIEIDPSGRVWAGVYVDYLVTEGGVSVYSGSEWIQYETADGLAGPNVRRLEIDANGNVWVATSTGLTRISDINIGLAEVAEAASFGLFPNPASDRVQLVLDGPVHIGQVMEVRDAAGRLVLANTLNGISAGIDVSALGTGMYTVRVGDRVQKLLVQR